MRPFATVYDLQAGWRNLRDPEAAVADELLRRASDIVRCAFEDDGVDAADLSPARLSAVKTVVCDMVRWSMLSGTEASDVEQEAWSQPMVGGGLMLNAQQRKLLGLSGTHAGLWGVGHED